MTVTTQTSTEPSETSDAQTSGRKGLFHEISDNILENPFQITVAGVVFLFVVGLILSIWRSREVIIPLANAEYARGLITFLVAIAAVLIALLLTLYAITGGAEDANHEKRFNRGKEILTIFLGILGTIVGFYFGSIPVVQGSAAKLSVSPVVISNEQPRNGETFSVMSLVTGGAAPYTYSIVFTPSNIIDDIPAKPSKDGVIQESIPISTSILSNTDVTMQIEVKDSAGATTKLESKTITVVAP